MKKNVTKALSVLFAGLFLATSCGKKDAGAETGEKNQEQRRKQEQEQKQE